MKLIIISVLFAAVGSVQPDTLTLEYCYSRVENHYPLAKKTELQQRITELNTQIAHTAYFPQLEVGARSSYQSEVTQFPGGSVPFQPSLSKDQYEFSLSVNQPVYNGGAIGIRKKLEETKGRQEELSVEVQIQEVRSQVEQVYYNILLAQQQENIVQLLIENLRAQLNTVSSQVDKGARLPSQKYILQAELTKARQDSAETVSNVRTGYEVLSELIGEDIKPDTPLKLSNFEFAQLAKSAPERVELQLFENRKSTFEYQKQLEATKKYPAVSLFGSAAYGRPGYNFFEDEMHGYYMAGVRIQWNFWDWKNAGTQSQALTFRQQKVEEDRRAFKKQLNTTLKRIEERVKMLKDQISRDKEIISLRKKVVAEKESQLRNGTITSTEYVTELNNALQSEYALKIHKVQLSRAQAEYKTALGLNSSN